jgi:release factor glutamine methyltransferase
MVDRRAVGLPLEHVLGWAQFGGLRIGVDHGVFVPRRRTEFLVRQAVALAPPRPVVVDLCCGSGAVGAGLVAALDQVELYAVDIDDATVRCARRNVTAAGGQVYQGDLYERLPATLRGRVDVLVATHPTCHRGDRTAAPRGPRPRAARSRGADGLGVLRLVTAGALLWLAPGGHLLVETSERQAPQAAATVARNGLIAPGEVRRAGGDRGHRNQARPSAFSVRLVESGPQASPAALPRATSFSAILRDASSIILPSREAAPRPASTASR